MPAWICANCGVQHAPASTPPALCEICADERAAVSPDGQRWTSLGELSATGYRTEWRELEPGLAGVGVHPVFGIGQRGLLVRTPAGNLLWDPPGFLDEDAVGRVRRWGGLAAVSASHPHFHGVQVEWSRVFGGAPVYVAEADEEWIRRPDPAVRLWSGRRQVLPGVTLVQCGGHFAGSAVVHWRDGAGSRGVLLVGDTLIVASDRRHVSFMRSHPNGIPLPPGEVRRLVGALEGLRFDRIYGGWWGQVVEADAERRVHRSADRYVSWVRDGADADAAK